VLHYGGLDFHAVLSHDHSLEEYQEFKARVIACYRSGSWAEVTTLIAREFPGRAHRLDDLFKDEQRRIIGIVLQDRFEDYQRIFEHLANQDEDLLNRLGQLKYPIPKALRAAASTYLDAHLNDAIDSLRRGETFDLDAIEQLRDRGRSWGYQPETDTLGRVLVEALQQILDEIRPDADLAAITSRASLILDAAAQLGVSLELWQVQNRFLDAFNQLSETGTLDQSLRQTFAQLVTQLNLEPSLLGWRP
jgi:hypothetical protein